MLFLGCVQAKRHEASSGLFQAVKAMNFVRAGESERHEVAVASAILAR